MSTFGLEAKKQKCEPYKHNLGHISIRCGPLNTLPHAGDW